MLFALILSFSSWERAFLAFCFLILSFSLILALSSSDLNTFAAFFLFVLSSFCFTGDFAEVLEFSIILDSAFSPLSPSVERHWYLFDISNFGSSIWAESFLFVLCFIFMLPESDVIPFPEDVGDFLFLLFCSCA